MTTIGSNLGGLIVVPCEAAPLHVDMCTARRALTQTCALCWPLGCGLFWPTVATASRAVSRPTAQFVEALLLAAALIIQ